MPSHARRRSVSSSSSSSSSSSDDEHKRKDKKDKKNKNKGGASDSQYGSARAPMSGPGYPNSPPPYDMPSHGGPTQEFMNIPGGAGFPTPPGAPPGFPGAPGPGFPSSEHDRSPFGHPGFPTPPHDVPGFPTPPHDGPGFPTAPHDAPGMPASPGFPVGPPGVGATTESHNRSFGLWKHKAPQPPAVPVPLPSPPSHNTAPPSGVRIALSSSMPFPDIQATGQPVSRDLDGSPIFIGSALMDRCVHPCKIAPALNPPCHVPFGGTEYNHEGRYDLLPVDPNTMEWVEASQGRIPSGRRPVEGGYEEHGGKLYHALGQIGELWVPGKTGEHLGGANLPFGGGEHVVRNYKILCWK